MTIIAIYLIADYASSMRARGQFNAIKPAIHPGSVFASAARQSSVEKSGFMDCHAALAKTWKSPVDQSLRPQYLSIGGSMEGA